jgi:glycosyltransferase involved in cell wall biosynthesis
MQSLMVGTPCVSTSIGIEGLNLEDGVHVLVADDAAQFAECVERLLTDEELWEKLRLDGRSHIMAAHGRESVRACFDSVLGQITSKPERARTGAA